MPTSAKDRLNRLLQNQAKPPMPDPHQSRFAEKELEAKQRQEQTHWTIPDVAQYPRLVKKQPAPPAHGADPLTSSDEDDDYVSAFQKKPTMKVQKPRRLFRPKPNATGYPKDACAESARPISYIPKGKTSQSAQPNEQLDDEGSSEVENEALPSEDAYGNAATGHFCLFNLLAKFPYKYIEDANDRVSRHFFAGGKFYERKWSL